MASKEKTKEKEKIEDKDRVENLGSSKKGLEQITDRSATSDFLSSRPEKGQQICLFTYAIPREPGIDGTVVVIKVIGCYEDGDEAEKRAIKEMNQQAHLKVVRIEPTGNWVGIRDPRLRKSHEYDKLYKGEVKRALRSMNGDLEKQEKDDERNVQGNGKG